MLSNFDIVAPMASPEFFVPTWQMLVMVLGLHFHQIAQSVFLKTGGPIFAGLLFLISQDLAKDIIAQSSALVLLLALIATVSIMARSSLAIMSSAARPSIGVWKSSPASQFTFLPTATMLFFSAAYWSGVPAVLAANQVAGIKCIAVWLFLLGSSSYFTVKVFTKMWKKPGAWLEYCLLSLALICVLLTATTGITELTVFSGLLFGASWALSVGNVQSWFFGPGSNRHQQRTSILKYYLCLSLFLMGGGLFWKTTINHLNI